jgi:hypothetical protein
MRSLAMHRKLSMSTMSLALPALDERLDLKATNPKKDFDKNAFYLEWFMGLGTINTDIENPTDMHHALCRLCAISTTILQHHLLE